MVTWLLIYIFYSLGTEYFKSVFASYIISFVSFDLSSFRVLFFSDRYVHKVLNMKYSASLLHLLQ